MRIRFLKPFTTWAAYGRESDGDSFVAPYDVKPSEIFQVDARTSDIFHLTQDIMLGQKLKVFPQEMWEVVSDFNVETTIKKN